MCEAPPRVSGLSGHLLFEPSADDGASEMKADDSSDTRLGRAVLDGEAKAETGESLKKVLLQGTGEASDGESLFKGTGENGGRDSGDGLFMATGLASSMDSLPSFSLAPELSSFSRLRALIG